MFCLGIDLLANVRDNLFDSIHAPGDGPWPRLFLARPSRSIVFIHSPYASSSLSYRPSVLLVLRRFLLRSCSSAWSNCTPHCFVEFPFEGGSFVFEGQRRRRSAISEGRTGFSRWTKQIFFWPCQWNVSILFYFQQAKSTVQCGPPSRASFREQERTCPFVFFFLFCFGLGSNRDR